MSRKAFIPKPKDGRKEASRNGATNTDPALDIDDLAKGDRAMPNCGNYGDSTPNVNSKQEDTWVPIGELASRLVQKAGKK